MKGNFEEVISSNLKKLLKEHNLNQRQLATIAGVSESTVGKWTLGKSTPRMGAVQKIADHFGIPKSEILTEDNPINLHETVGRTVQIPVLGKIACGDPIFVAENFSEYRTELADNVPPGNITFLKADGDSMEPTIPDQAYVMIREQPDVESGEIAAVLVNGDSEATLKRVRKQGDTVMLIPDNPDYDTLVITEDYPARIIGKAVKYTFDL